MLAAQRPFEPRLAVGCLFDLESVAAERIGDRIADRGLIIDDENTAHGSTRLATRGTCIRTVVPTPTFDSSSSRPSNASSGPDDCESQAEAFGARARAVETVEHAGLLLTRDSRPRIGDDDLGPLVGGTAFDRDSARQRVLGGVVGDVDERLLHELAVRDHRQLGGETGLTSTPCAGRIEAAISVSRGSSATTSSLGASYPVCARARINSAFARRASRFDSRSMCPRKTSRCGRP